jgi:hypothetical protein
MAEGGVYSLFRGMGAPFATVAFYNAVLFAARGQMESMLAHPDGMVCMFKLFEAHHSNVNCRHDNQCINELNDCLSVSQCCLPDIRVDRDLVLTSKHTHAGSRAMGFQQIMHSFVYMP